MRSKRAGGGYFGPELFGFLRALKANNNREWFQENKARYVRDVRDPMLRFITDFGDRLCRISPQFAADPRPVGGSLFRIHRDTRFSKDKSPYKTNVGAHFPHRGCGKDAHAPGFYLHLEPGGCFGGGGIWHPDAAALEKIRRAMVDRPREWKAVLAKKLPIEGDALKRPPRGFDPAHPFVEDLKRKDLYVMSAFGEKEACANDFMDRYAEMCVRASPLVRFLTAAVGLSW